MTDGELRQECIELAEWFYRFHPNEDDAVARLLWFAKFQQAVGVRMVAEHLMTYPNRVLYGGETR